MDVSYAGDGAFAIAAAADMILERTAQVCAAVYDSGAQRGMKFNSLPGKKSIAC